MNLIKIGLVLGLISFIFINGLHFKLSDASEEMKVEFKINAFDRKKARKIIDNYIQDSINKDAIIKL